MHDFDSTISMAGEIARRVAEQGGRAYYVGGIVRDALMGRENKDVDIEVHAIAPAALEAILDSLGERLTMGVSFGVYGLRHYDLDIAMPRTERATGRGHRDFAVFVDPFLGTEKAARRRDFTINAMMRDVLTGEIVDPFGGRDDLARGVIRHVDDTSFAADPLRVLRAAQFAARFGFDIAPETTALCSRMDLTALARERVEGELTKALLKADRPSVFFETLRDMNQLTAWFPEIASFGESWPAAMHALDRLAPARKLAQNPTGLMLAAPLSFMSEDAARAQLARITTEVRLTSYALSLAAHANAAVRAASDKPPLADTNALFDAVPDPRALVLLACAICPDADSAFLDARLAAFDEIMQRPFVMGRDLIAAGMKPGRDFSRMLDYAHGLRLCGVAKDEALSRTLEYAKKSNI